MELNTTYIFSRQEKMISKLEDATHLCQSECITFKSSSRRRQQHKDAHKHPNYHCIYKYTHALNIDA